MTTVGILRCWLQARDRDRWLNPFLPKRDRDLLALRETVWHCTRLANGLNRIIDREVRKP